MSTNLFILTASLDWTTTITAGISVISGGALLGLYNAWVKKNRGDVADERSYEESLRSRIAELEEKVDYLTDKITELVASNSKVIIQVSSENAALVERNQRLLSDNILLNTRVEELELQLETK